MMRVFLIVMTVAAVMGLAFWAYRENYTTQAALREMAALQTEVAALKEAIAVQRAEWAYLNRPDRLRDLVALNFARLPLLPLDPGQFVPVTDVALPRPPTPLQSLDPVETTGALAQGEDAP